MTRTEYMACKILAKKWNAPTSFVRKNFEIVESTFEFQWILLGVTFREFIQSIKRLFV